MTVDPVRIKAAVLREAMMAFAAERGSARAVDPMEVAVRVAGHDEKVWRRLMKPIREEARRLAADRQIVVLRKGKPADPATLRGLWRFRLRDPNEAEPVIVSRGGKADPLFDDDD